MPYTILIVNDSHKLVIRDADDPTNTLHLGDHRDLLLLRQRLNAYVADPIPDGSLAILPPPEDAIISTTQAHELAARHNTPVEESTLRMAMTRGVIPGAHKRGGRWFLPREQFEVWLADHLKRK